VWWSIDLCGRLRTGIFIIKEFDNPTLKEWCDRLREPKTPPRLSTTTPMLGVHITESGRERVHVSYRSDRIADERVAAPMTEHDAPAVMA
jgi:hypothetical protein